MPDISMCDGKNCPIRKTCYRHTATPTEHHQAYFTVAPYDAERATCSHYWPNVVNTGTKIGESKYGK